MLVNAELRSSDTITELYAYVLNQIGKCFFIPEDHLVT